MDEKDIKSKNEIFILGRSGQAFVIERCGRMLNFFDPPKLSVNEI